MRKTLLPLMMAGAVMFPLTAMADDHSEMPGVIHVTASATADVDPDRATITAGVVSEGSTAQEAMTRNSEMMRNVFASLDTAGVAEADIATSSLNLRPQYNYERQNRGQPQIIGYQAGNRVTITTQDLDRSGAIIDAMLQAGVNNIDGVNFTVSDPDAALDMARETAIRKAQVKASAMAQAANVELGRLLSLKEGSTPGPIAYDQIVVTGARMESAMAPPLSPGQREIAATVTMSFAIDN